MRTRRAALLGTTLALALWPLMAPSLGGSAAANSDARAAAAQTPTAGSLYKDGPSGRYLLGGTWLFRLDDGVGTRERFEDSVSSSGWRAITVPNAWNAGEQTPAGYAPAVGWYRKDFVLPSASPSDTWIVRFESVNNSVTIWLNGHQIGSHTGAYLAFEVLLPAADLDRASTNRLVLRVSDAHSETDIPPLSAPGPAGVIGGWWNYGGLLREVYLRRVAVVDFASVQVLPRIACASCSAKITYSVVVRNYATTAQYVAVRTSYGGVPASLGAQTIGPGASATFAGQARIARPVLWSPSDPHLYPVTLAASGGPAPGPANSPLAHYFLESGIRAISVVGGHLELNFAPVHLRGIGLVEDSPSLGAAISPALALSAMRRAKELGATLVRSQYPLSAYEEQLADELGLMLWSEIPVYQAKDGVLRAITAPAVAMLRENILENGNHPSIIVWSIANELAPEVSPAQRSYIADAVAAAHTLDPTRPVGLAFAGYPSVGCQSGYGPLDVLGVNDYFGWYPGPSGQIADLSELPDYLEQVRACYPAKALFVTEFGAEANRAGPIDERGTYAFQSQYVASQLGALAASPFLSGAVYWALQDFLVRPGWTGGNPYPSPPVFQKGLLDFNGNPKPAFTVAQQLFAATRQVG